MKSNGKNAILWGVVGAGALLLAREVLRKTREMDLRDKIVVIMGGSRGLGLVMAREFAVREAKIALCARDLEELDRAKADLQERGADVFVAPCDVTNKAEIGQFINAARMQFGQIDVLVNNAGMIQVSPLEHLTEADYDESLKTHFWAAYHAINEVLPEMRERGEGRIVNISSIGGKAPIPHLNAYSTGKFALTGYSEGLRAELLPHNIFVTTVCPGMMRTGSPRNAFFKGRHEAEYAWFKISDSIPGLSTSAEDAARQIVRATARGDAELIVTLPAQALAAFHGLFPGLSADLLSVMNRFLPQPGGIGENRVKGKDSETAASDNFLTALTDQAAEDNNQIVN